MNELVKARPLIRELIKLDPHDRLARISYALSYSEAGQPRKAVPLLREALDQFGEDKEILFMLAETYSQLEQHEEAEEMFRRSLAATPKALRNERSECLNGIGVALWQRQRRKEALEAWREAVSLDPKNAIARRNLDECTNTYNEPKAPSPIFDDLYHFQKIQVDKYLAKTRKKELRSEKEFMGVMEAITRAWNEHIAPLGEKLDRMTSAEKSELFAKINIDVG